MKIECPFCRSKISDEAVVCPQCGAEKTIKYGKRGCWNIYRAVIGSFMSVLGLPVTIVGIRNFYLLWSSSLTLMEYVIHGCVILLLLAFFLQGVVLVVTSTPGTDVEIIMWHRNGVEKSAL